MFGMQRYLVNLNKDVLIDLPLGPNWPCQRGHVIFNRNIYMEIFKNFSETTSFRTCEYVKLTSTKNRGHRFCYTYKKTSKKNLFLKPHSLDLCYLASDVV